MNHIDLEFAALDVSLATDRAAGPNEEVTVELVRELEASDLVLLDTNRGIKPQPLKRLTMRHHSLARCIALGMKISHAAAACGYIPSSVGILQMDPTFRNLVAFYKSEQDVIFADVNKQMADLSEEVLFEMRRRIEEEPEEISTTQLISLMKEISDRTGHGPSATVNNNHVHLHVASRLENARKRVLELNVTKEIDL